MDKPFAYSADDWLYLSSTNFETGPTVNTSRCEDKLTHYEKKLSHCKDELNTRTSLFFQDPVGNLQDNHHLPSPAVNHVTSYSDYQTNQRSYLNNANVFREISSSHMLHDLPEHDTRSLQMTQHTSTLGIQTPNWNPK
jgi:hypothetical protein